MPKLLVVDDDADMRLLLTRIFVHRGFTVSVGKNGEEALEMVAKDPPDALILDLQLPKIDGHEVCRRLKSDPKTQKIPILMLTAAYTAQADADRGLLLGADEYVVKPFVREVLIHNVLRLIGAEPPKPPPRGDSKPGT